MRTVGGVSVAAEYGAVRLILPDEESDNLVAAKLLEIKDAQDLLVALQAEIRDARNAAVS